ELATSATNSAPPPITSRRPRRSVSRGGARPSASKRGTGRRSLTVRPTIAERDALSCAGRGGPNAPPAVRVVLLPGPPRRLPGQGAARHPAPGGPQPHRGGLRRRAVAAVDAQGAVGPAGRSLRPRRVRPAQELARARA